MQFHWKVGHCGGQVSGIQNLGSGAPITPCPRSCGGLSSHSGNSAWYMLRAHLLTFGLTIGTTCPPSLVNTLFFFFLILCSTVLGKSGTDQIVSLSHPHQEPRQQKWLLTVLSSMSHSPSLSFHHAFQFQLLSILAVSSSQLPSPSHVHGKKVSPL